MTNAAPPRLTIRSERVCHIVGKARELDTKSVAADIGKVSNPSDDATICVLADRCDDPVYEELLHFIAALNKDGQADLLALARPARGDDSTATWPTFRMETSREPNNQTWSSLPGASRLAEYLEERLSQCDRFREEFSLGRLRSTRSS
jgi:hypothetical protein